MENVSINQDLLAATRSYLFFLKEIADKSREQMAMIIILTGIIERAEMD